MSIIEQSRQGNVLVLTVNNPPVNAFSPGVPEGLHAGLDVAEKDDSIGAVVIIGGGRTFIAGADIKTFDMPREQAPDLRGFISRLDGFPKPTVAAIHGTALGGGMEMVLGCDIVVAAAEESLTRMRAGLTHAVVNSDFSVTSDFVRGFAAQARSGDVARELSSSSRRMTSARTSS